MRWLPARAHDNGLFLIYSNGIGVDDNEIRTGNAMILDPYGRILAETWKAGDDMVVADLDASLLEVSTGRRWIKTRRPELYEPLTVPTGLEQDTRTVRFDKKGVRKHARSLTRTGWSDKSHLKISIWPLGKQPAIVARSRSLRWKGSGKRAAASFCPEPLGSLWNRAHAMGRRSAATPIPRRV